MSLIDRPNESCKTTRDSTNASATNTKKYWLRMRRGVVGRSKSPPDPEGRSPLHCALRHNWRACASISPVVLPTMVRQRRTGSLTIVINSERRLSSECNTENRNLFMSLCTSPCEICKVLCGVGWIEARSFICPWQAVKQLLRCTSNSNFVICCEYEYDLACST